MEKKKISASTREELVSAIAERYRAATRAEKLTILDEFVAVTGYHRKHAIRVLNSGAEAAELQRRCSRRRERCSSATEAHGRSGSGLSS